MPLSVFLPVPRCRPSEDRKEGRERPPYLTSDAERKAPFTPQRTMTARALGGMTAPEVFLVPLELLFSEGSRRLSILSCRERRLSAILSPLSLYMTR
jgi:hypothetical protein